MQGLTLDGGEKMGIGFGFFQIMFSLVFIIVFGMVIMTAVKGISQWNKNNHSPRLTVPATIVAKRTNVSSHHHHRRRKSRAAAGHV